MKFEQEELGTLLRSFGYFFCLMAAYYVLRPLREEMGIAGGVRNLQWLYTGTFVVTCAGVPLYSWMVARLTRQSFIIGAYAFFALNLLVFWALMRALPEEGVVHVGRAFFIWLSVFNMYAISIFWSFMADVFRNDQARRLFGFIAAGGSLGALAGSLLTAGLAEAIGPIQLIPISVVLLLATVLFVRGLSRAAAPGRVRSVADEPDEGSTGQPTGGGIFTGIAMVGRSPYLIGICLYLFLHTLTGTFAYFMQAEIVAAHYEVRAAEAELAGLELDVSAERTKLFAQMNFATQSLTLLGQSLVTARVIAALGIGATLTLLPAFLLVGFSTLGLYPTLGVLVVFQVLRRASNFALAKPAREVLFTVVGREAKYKSKAFIDTVVYRGGDMVSGWVFHGLRTLGMGLAAIAFSAVPVTAIWIGLGLYLGRRQESFLRTPPGGTPGPQPSSRISMS